LSISGVLAANAATVAAASHVTSITVSDTAANVLANIASLETLATGTVLSSIVLTDSTTPTLALTAAQFAADTAAFGKIGSAYNLTVSAVTAGNASTVAGNTHVTSISVSDTAANVVANLTGLQTLATGTKLLSIALTDVSTPTLALTAVQCAADITALNKITSSYNLAITDTAANVVANIAALQTLAAAGKLTSIVLTGASTPTLLLTSAQYSADGTALSKITSAYNLSISGVTAANAATVAGAAHVTSITVSDTAANVVTNIAALQTLATGTKLSSIALTDGSTPTLSLTAAQYSADGSALGKISSAYNLSISGVTVSNAASIAGAAHVTKVAVSDSAANVNANLDTLQTLAAAGKIGSITLTDGTKPTLTITAAQQTKDATVLSEIASAYNLVVTGGGVSAATAATATSPVAVSDTAANVVTYLSKLQSQAVAGRIISIAFTDSAAPTLTLTKTQLTGDATVLSKITSVYALTLTGGGTITEPNGVSAKTVTLQSASSAYSFTANATASLTIVDNGTRGGDVLNANAGDTVNIGGNGFDSTEDDVYISGGTVVVQGNATAAIGGDKNVITAGLNDTVGLYGSGNTITAGSGDSFWIGGDTSFTNDVINGGGNEQYNFFAGFGHDTINNGTSATTNGSIIFDDRSDENVWFQKSGNDLLVSILGTNDQIDIAGWYSGTAGKQVQTFNDSNGLILDTQVAQLVQAMAAYQSANPGFNPVTTTTMPTNTTLQGVITASWHH
jgi:hypothetical protein